MAYVDLYCDAETALAFTDSGNVVGAPSAGNDAPFAVKVLGATESAGLTCEFAPYTIPGTVTAATILTKGRQTAGTDTIAEFTNMTGAAFNGNASVPETNFGDVNKVANAITDAAGLRSALAAGTLVLDCTYTSTLGATVQVKGVGVRITYTETSGEAGVSAEEATFIWENE